MDILHLLSPPELDALRAIADHRPVASTAAAKQLIPMGLVEELLPNRFELTGQGQAILDDRPVRDAPTQDRRDTAARLQDARANDVSVPSGEGDDARSASHCIVQ